MNNLGEQNGIFNHNIPPFCLHKKRIFFNHTKGHGDFTFAMCIVNLWKEEQYYLNVYYQMV